MEIVGITRAYHPTIQTMPARGIAAGQRARESTQYCYILICMFKLLANEVAYEVRGVVVDAPLPHGSSLSLYRIRQQHGIQIPCNMHRLLNGLLG